MYAEELTPVRWVTWKLASPSRNHWFAAPLSWLGEGFWLRCFKVWAGGGFEGWHGCQGVLSSCSKTSQDAFGLLHHFAQTVIQGPRVQGHVSIGVQKLEAVLVHREKR